MGAKYVDISSIVQVIGCIYQNPGLLDSEKYVFNEEDFTEDFHRIIFGSIFNNNFNNHKIVCFFFVIQKRKLQVLVILYVCSGNENLVDRTFAKMSEFKFLSFLLLELQQIFWNDKLLINFLFSKESLFLSVRNIKTSGLHISISSANKLKFIFSNLTKLSDLLLNL